MRPIKDLTGMIFGRLTAQKVVRVEPGRGAVWYCTCTCGGEKEVFASRLTGKKTQSCGCITKERSSMLKEMEQKRQAYLRDEVDPGSRPRALDYIGDSVLDRRLQDVLIQRIHGISIEVLAQKKFGRYVGNVA